MSDLELRRRERAMRLDPSDKERVSAWEHAMQRAEIEPTLSMELREEEIPYSRHMRTLIARTVEALRRHGVTAAWKIEVVLSRWADRTDNGFFVWAREQTPPKRRVRIHLLEESEELEGVPSGELLIKCVELELCVIEDLGG